MDRLRSQDRLDKMRDLRRVRRRKIMIQKLTEGEDEWGNAITEWAPWRELWADRESLWGQEYFAARAVNEQNTVTFVLRYVPFLDQLNTTHYRVLFTPVSIHDDDPTTDITYAISSYQTGTTRIKKQLQTEYDIVHIDRLRDDGMWIKLRCQERGANGK